MRRLVRYVAVGIATLGAEQRPLFCGHVHRRRDLAEVCERRMRLRLTEGGAQVDVRTAETWRPDSDGCPFVDHHQPGRTCRLCGATP